MTVNQCNFERITRSLRRVRAEPTSRQARQDIAFASMGFSTLCELEDDIAQAQEDGTSALRAEEFRQKRSHMARAACCMEAVFSLPDLEPLLGPIDKVARNAVLTSLKQCHPLDLAPLPVDLDSIEVPEGLSPDIIKMILDGQHKAGNWDPWVPHQALFEHRHAELSPPFHAEIVETFHSSDPGWVYLCFRNSGKSTLSEEGFILRACLRLFGNALVLGFNQQRAIERLESIKHELETNERIGAIFGDVRGEVWQGQKVTMGNGVCLQAVGSGQSLRGIKHYDFRPDCLLLDDVEGDVGASTPLEREATKKWFFGVVLPALASKSIIRMAATPLDQECLPITLGKMPTWKTMTVPVRHIGGNENAFFESWLAEQGIDKIDIQQPTRDEAHKGNGPADAEESKIRDTVRKLIAAKNPPSNSALMRIIAAHEGEPSCQPPLNQKAQQPPPDDAGTLSDHNAETKTEVHPDTGRGPLHPRRTTKLPDAKSSAPAPGSTIKREMSELERAMNFSFRR